MSVQAQRLRVGEHRSGMRLNHDFKGESLSEALVWIDNAQSEYKLNFIFDELEDFTVTTQLKNVSVRDAVRQVCGFYPMHLTFDRQDIYIECMQKSETKLSGRIVDEAGQPIAYANVALLSPSDSTFINGGVSNEAGDFVIPYRLDRVLARITCIGYKTIYRLCDQPEVGTIRLLPDTYTLKGVLVKGHTPILRREAGSIIFDTRNIAGAINATDLLRYSPGVMLTDDNITLFGTNGIIFCIDGKEQHMGQKEMLQMLKSYPASDVEKIEIIQAPGAKHSAEGNAGIINLILKKKGNDYVGGSFGYAHTQYEEHGDEVNASIIYNRGKVSTTLNVAGTWDNTRYRETNEIAFDNHTRSNIDNGHIGKDNYSARWQIDYGASDRLSLGAYAMISDGDRQLYIDGEYLIGIEDAYGSNIITTETRRHEGTRNYAANVNASQKLNDHGAKIDYNLDYYHMTMSDDRTSETLRTLTGNLPVDFNYQNEIGQTVTNYSAKVDASIGNFKLGSQYAYTRSQRELSYSWVPDDQSWSDFAYDEQVLAAYAEYRGRLGDRVTFDIGGRYEHTWTKGCQHTNIFNYSHCTQYGRLFPSLNIAYQPSQNHSFNWSLSTRITRPNVINVNPDTLSSDAYHRTTGNPFLKPTYLYKAMMGYTYKGVLSFDLYYTYEPERMTLVPYTTDQLTFSTWDNSVNGQDFGINAFYYFDRLRWMTAILMQGIGYSKTTSSSPWTLSRIENINYVGVLQASFFFDRDRKWIANLNFTYNSREKDVTKSLNARYMMDVGLQHRFWKDRLTLGLTCRNLLASRIKGKEYQSLTTMDFDNKFNYRQLRLTLTYNWGASLRQNHRQYKSDELQERVVNDF